MVTDYYSSTVRKIGDFLFGFLVAPIIPVLLASNSGSAAGWIVAILFMIAGIIISFALHRRFLAIGMICVLLVPLLVFGACLLMLSRMKF